MTNRIPPSQRRAATLFCLILICLVAACQDSPTARDPNEQYNDLKGVWVSENKALYELVEDTLLCTFVPFAAKKELREGKGLVWIRDIRRKGNGYRALQAVRKRGKLDDEPMWIPAELTVQGAVLTITFKNPQTKQMMTRTLYRKVRK